MGCKILCSNRFGTRSHSVNSPIEEYVDLQN